MRALLAFLLAFAALGTAGANAGPLIVGVGLPRTGALADFGADYAKALELWRDEINAAGGLVGRAVELRVIDDRSDGAGAGRVYEQLIGEHKAEVLIGPYGSAATLGAAAAAERASRVLLNAAGATRAIHNRAPRFVFQVTAPYVGYGMGPVELAAHANYRRVFIVARDDPVSREMAEAAREAALARGLRPAEIAYYRPGTEDFATEVETARALRTQAWLAFSEAREAAGLVRTFRKQDYAPPLFFARGAADAKFIALVGQDAEFALGLAEYQPRWRTAGNAAFVKAFRARWGADPGFAAARAYAAAMVLGEAVRRSGGTDQEKLRAVLSTLQSETVLGGYRVDAESGEQRSARPAVVQILKGRPEVIWPGALQTAKPVLPYAEWSERRLLK